MSDLEDWVSITEAAERLSASGDVVDRSTLSRYLTQHEGALERRKSGRESLVEFNALKAHRGENVRLRTSGRAMPAPHAPRRVAGSQSDGMARKANADADLREMELARKRGLLTIKGEVEQAAADAIALMQSAFERAVEGAAASISVRHGWEERKVRIELKNHSRTGLEAFNSSLRKRLDELERARMAADHDLGDDMAASALQ